MKNLNLVLLVCLTISSCTYVDEELIQSKDSPNKDSRETEKFQVSLKSAKFFAERVQFDDSLSREVESIDCITYGKDTLMYLVNRVGGEGWLVLSGDKRTEAILASSNTGKIDKNKLDGSTVWFEDLANKIYGLKLSNNKDTTGNNYDMWCKVDTLALGLIKESNDMVFSRSTRSPENGGFDSRSILIDFKVDVTNFKEVGPLIQTKWGQKSPWNNCTPEWQDTEQRCPTGCVAVAGAQMLYFFHYFKNKPSEFYSQGQCDALISKESTVSNSFSFSYPNNEVWDEMATMRNEGTFWSHQLVGILMGYVGWKVNMKYGEASSGAYTSDLVNVYREFGINSEYSDYSPEAVRTSLDKQTPVNICAYSKKKGIEIFGQPIITWEYYGGHAWIIDGYYDKRTRYTYVFQRLSGTDSNEIGNKDLGDELLPHRPINGDGSNNIYTVYTSSRTYYWKMNFGWNSTGDDGEYATGESDIWETSNGNFEYKKKIIHNFSF